VIRVGVLLDSQILLSLVGDEKVAHFAGVGVGVEAELRGDGDSSVVRAEDEVVVLVPGVDVASTSLFVGGEWGDKHVFREGVLHVVCDVGVLWRRSFVHRRNGIVARIGFCAEAPLRWGGCAW
jgi:hypothetical protein